MTIKPCPVLMQLNSGRRHAAVQTLMATMYSVFVVLLTSWFSTRGLQSHLLQFISLTFEPLMMYASLTVDIKPYHPADCLPQAISAPWLSDAGRAATHAMHVRYSREAACRLQELVPKLEFYDK